MALFTAVGLLPQTTESVLTIDEHFAAVRRAGELAEELDVAEVRKAAPFLRSLTVASREIKERGTTYVILRLAK